MSASKALYVAYLTGVGGQAVGLFYIGDGLVVGVDGGTMQYDGSYTTRGGAERHSNPCIGIVAREATDARFSLSAKPNHWQASAATV
jgi:hypothetical protein